MCCDRKVCCWPCAPKARTISRSRILPGKLSIGPVASEQVAMSLATPEKLRTLQRKPYCKAKAEPAFRFYALYDKICREIILRHACVLARDNAGASQTAQDLAGQKVAVVGPSRQIEAVWAVNGRSRPRPVIRQHEEFGS